MKLKGLGEEAVVAALLRGLPTSGRDVVCGPGDDCAVIGSPRGRLWQLLKTDCVIEGIHFRSNEDAGKIGWKALARAVSDIAAMGGRPLHALVTLAISPDEELARAAKVYAGLGKCAEKYGITIVGGETARSPGPMFVSVMLSGEVERHLCVFRSGGKPGDRLFVTGRLGGSSGGRHLTFEPRLEQAQWLTRHCQVHAMMDLSDGLGADLPRLALASGCGYRLDEAALPLHAGCTVKQGLSDGEDYELLFALAPPEAERLRILWPRKFPRLRLTGIGELAEPAEAPRGKRGQKKTSPDGYDHFA